MPKADIVAAALAAIASGSLQIQTDAIGAACDAMALEQKASDGTLNQSDVDALVAAKVGQAVADAQAADAAALAVVEAADAQKLADAQAAFDADHAAMQEVVDSVTAKELKGEAAVKALQDAMAAMKASWDTLQSLFPAPPPPVDPAPAQA